MLRPIAVCVKLCKKPGSLPCLIRFGRITSYMFIHVDVKLDKLIFYQPGNTTMSSVCYLTMFRVTVDVDCQVLRSSTY